MQMIAVKRLSSNAVRPDADRFVVTKRFDGPNPIGANDLTQIDEVLTVWVTAQSWN
jgi:hypothetical protein